VRISAKRPAPGYVDLPTTPTLPQKRDFGTSRWQLCDKLHPSRRTGKQA